jgi:microcystin-dependent protein
MDKQLVAFTVHTTNGAGPVTMSVDSVPNVPLRSAPNQELPAGVLIQGSSYCVVFNQADNALYLQSFFGNPFSVPLGGMIDFIGSTSPNSSFAVPIGQAISRTTYATLFALVGTTYGVGDGTSTFNILDCRGRVSAMLDPTGTILTGATMSPNGNTLGATGGAQTETLTAGQIPEITSNVQVSVSGSISGNAAAGSDPVNLGTQFVASTPSVGPSSPLTVTGSFSGSGSGAAQSNNTGGAAHLNVQPTILVNKLIRVI